MLCVIPIRDVGHRAPLRTRDLTAAPTGPILGPCGATRYYLQPYPTMSAKGPVRKTPRPFRPPAAPAALVTVRLPVAVLTRATKMAEREGVSRNQWLVSAIESAITPAKTGAAA